MSTLPIKEQLEFSALITSAIVLTVGLSWNNAMNALIDEYVPSDVENSKNGWVKLIYAIVLTIIASFVAMYFL